MTNEEIQAYIKEKAKSIASLKKKINAKIAKENPSQGQLIISGDEVEMPDVMDVGNLAWNMAYHGGLRRGTFNLIDGADGIGKSQSTYEFMAQIQKDGGRIWLENGQVAKDDEGNPIKIPGMVVLITNEGLTPWSDLEARGVVFDDDKFFAITAAAYAEQGLDELVSTLNDNAFKNRIDLIVLDSIAGFLPRSERDKAVKDGLAEDTMGQLAKMLTKFCRVIWGTGIGDHAAIIGINQLRDNLSSYGGGVTSPGGHAVKHYKHTHVRLKTNADDKIWAGEKNKSEQIGHKVHLTTIKYKAGGGGHVGEEFEYDVFYGKGADTVPTVLQAARNAGVVTGTTWLSFNLPKESMEAANLLDANGESIKIQGEKQTVARMREDRTLLDAIYGEVIKAKQAEEDL